MLQRQHQLARSGNAGNHGDAAFFCGFGEIDVEAGADGKHSACIGDGFELLAVGYGAGADNGIGHFFFDLADGFEAGGGAQGDFQGGNAAFNKGVRQIYGG